MSDSPRRSPTVALLTLSRVAELELARVLEPHALSLRKFDILTRIGTVPGMSTADLARRTGLDAAALAPMLRSLQDAGLTRPADERGATVGITPAGARLLADLSPQLAAIDARLFDDEDGDARALANALLAATAETSAEPQD
ncbi:MAG: MarR family transcriptional regulator [Pseudolysinimonas sp.]